MDIKIQSPEKVVMIDGFDGKKIVVDGVGYSSTHVLYPKKISPFPEFDIENVDHFDLLVQNSSKALDVVIIGTGDVHIFPKIFELLNEKYSMSFEFMSTRVACYTYNTLVLEGRNVCACLILTA